jgi:hypothetical protein
MAGVGPRLPGSPADWRVAGLWGAVVWYEERAGIREFMGQQPRRDAELAAEQDTRRWWGSLTDRERAAMVAR